MSTSRHVVTLNGPDLIIVRTGPLIVSRWLRPPTVDMVTRNTPPFMAAAEAITSKVLLCSVIRADLGVPDSDTRAALERFLRSVDRRCAGAVNLVDGSGFGSAALRAVVTGLSLVVRPSYPVKTVATPTEAARLLAQWWPADAPARSADELTQAIDAART